MKLKKHLDIGVFQGGGGSTITVNCGGCGCDDDCCCGCALTGEINPALDEAIALHYSVNPVGGTGPYTYEWDVAQNGGIGADALIVIDGANNTPIVTLLSNGSASGLLRCKITDGNGNIGYAYYMAVVAAV